MAPNTTGEPEQQLFPSKVTAKLTVNKPTEMSNAKITADTTNTTVRNYNRFNHLLGMHGLSWVIVACMFDLYRMSKWASSRENLSSGFATS